MLGDYESTQILMEKEVDINVNDSLGHSPLIWTAIFGYEKIANILLQKSDININAKDHTGRTGLIWAAKNGFDNIVKILLK